MVLNVVRASITSKPVWGQLLVGRLPAESPAGCDVNSRRLLRIYLREPGVFHT
jgi:hypothetical protein